MIGEHWLAFGNAGENSDFSFLSQFGVLAVLLNWHAEHLGCGRAVDVLTLSESVQHPLLARQPRDHARFDGAVVGDRVELAGGRDECRADELREGVGDAAPAEPEHFQITSLDELPGLSQAVQMVLW